MPDTPTPGVKGQLSSGPALHASISISSLDPAAMMVGFAGSTATVGSFCLFCENGRVGSVLPTFTRLSWANAGAATAPKARTT